jgi:RimJ/RimL family protein N-acetyltransferase
MRKLTLQDGTVLLVRPLEPEDRERLDAAVAKLSPQSRYLRFAAPKPRLTKADLDHLLDLDHHDREALLAFDPSTGEGIAVARYAPVTGQAHVVEVAVTVTDAYQGRGAGTALTALLTERARAEGVVALRAVTLAENTRAIAMLRRGGFRPVGRDGAMLEFELGLAEARAA